MALNNFQDLIAWQKSMKLVLEVYRLVKYLPQAELYGLSNQMRRAAVSIPSNIAEGQARGTTKDFIHFLHIAKGSNTELFTQLMICQNLGYLEPEQLKTAMVLNQDTGMLLTKLIKSLKSIRLQKMLIKS